MPARRENANLCQLRTTTTTTIHLFALQLIIGQVNTTTEVFSKPSTCRLDIAYRVASVSVDADVIVYLKTVIPVYEYTHMKLMLLTNLCSNSALIQC